MRSNTRFIQPSYLFLLLLLLLGGGELDSAEASVAYQAAEPPARRVAIASDQIGAVKLIGTVVSAKPAERVAIVADSATARQWLLREGDQIGLLTIKRILLDRVIVDSGSGVAALKLRRNITSGSAISRSDSQYSSLTARPIKAGPRSSHYVLDREKVAAVSARPENVQEMLTVEPGKLFNRDKGIRITSIEPGSIFPKMGLRTGDLLLSVNDSDVLHAEDVAAIIDTMQTQNNVDLKVRRRARTYHLYVQIQ